MAKVNNIKRGYALILVVGILAVLVLINLSFAISLRLEQNTTAAYIKGAKAQYLADAGINNAISELKADAKLNFVYTGSISNYSDDTLYANCGSYSVDIEDEQRKVNIDKANRDLLKNLLGDGDYTRADDIITARPFETNEQIGQVTGIDEATFNDIIDDITIYSYRDPNTLDSAGGSEARCPINVNTASENVIKAVLAGTGLSSADVNTAYGAINTSRPFSSWVEFDNCIDSTGLSAANKQIIKDNANPNRQKPSPHTTDFCFHSGGKYTLISTGILYATSAKTRTIAEKKIERIVDIYGILNQTKKSQFQGSDGATLPIAWKVTVFDDCPVRGDQQDLYDSGASAYEAIPNSIKIGFWDDFDEDGQNAVFYMNDTNWAVRGTGSADGEVWGGVLYGITDADASGDNELRLTTTGSDSSWNPVWLESNSPSSGMTWTDFSYNLQQDNVSYTDDRGAEIWNVAFPVYRSDLSSGIKDEDTWWPPLHFTSQERWYPGHDQVEAISPNQYWDIVMRVKYVCSASTLRYYLKNNSQNLNSSFRTDDVGASTSGAAGFWGWNVQARFDNIRIIPQSPDGNGDYAYFVSTRLPVAAFTSDVEWGTIWGTVTIPSSASSDTEKAYFQLSTDGGSSWSPAEPGLETQGVINLTGTQIQYKANFEIDANQSYAGDQQYRETPVLEDVFITYLPSMRILYGRSL